MRRFLTAQGCKHSVRDHYGAFGTFREGLTQAIQERLNDKFSCISLYLRNASCDLVRMFCPSYIAPLSAAYSVAADNAPLLRNSGIIIDEGEYASASLSVSEARPSCCFGLVWSFTFFATPQGKENAGGWNMHIRQDTISNRILYAICAAWNELAVAGISELRLRDNIECTWKNMCGIWFYYQFCPC